LDPHQASFYGYHLYAIEVPFVNFQHYQNLHTQPYRAIVYAYTKICFHHSQCDNYNNIQNGVSKRADLKAQMIQPGNKEGSDDPLVTSNQFDPSKGYTQSSPVPDSLDPNEVMAWVNAQNISPQRKALLNKGLNVYKKARYNNKSRNLLSNPDL